MSVAVGLRTAEIRALASVRVDWAATKQRSAAVVPGLAVSALRWQRNWRRRPRSRLVIRICFGRGGKCP